MSSSSIMLSQKAKPKPQKGQFERMARMPRDQLLDELFRAFQERERWSIKVLRERTQQPEAYLKEVLSEIAFLHRSGEFNGSWELLANYKGEGVSDPALMSPAACGLLSLGIDQSGERPYPCRVRSQGGRCQYGRRRRRLG